VVDINQFYGASLSSLGKGLIMTNDKSIWTSGGRKNARARIILSKGKGEFVVNGVPYSEYFSNKDDWPTLMEPFEVVGCQAEEFDISLRVAGGGRRGQLQACRHAIARALEKLNSEWRKKLKPAGLLTRDSRIKERKKNGLKKARRAPQWSKR